MNRTRRRVVLALALGAVTMLLVAPSAGAATFGGGKVKLSFGKSFAKALKATKTRVRGTGGTVTKGRTATFTIRSGTGTLASPYSATLDLGGTLDFKRGKRTKRFKSLDEVVSGSKGRFKSGKSTIFSEATKGKVAAESGFTGLDARKVRIKLTRSGARALNRKLRTKRFKRNMTAGTLRFDADRSVTFQAGGNTRIAIDNGTAVKLGGCGVSLTAEAPATRTTAPTSQTTPNVKFNFPVSGGVLTAKGLEGAIQHSGGIRLTKGSKTSTLTEVELALAQSGSSFSAIASDASNQRITVGALNRTGQTVQRQYTATGTSLTFTGGALTLGVQAATLLQQNYGCSNVAPGDPLGTLETAGGPIK